MGKAARMAETERALKLRRLQAAARYNPKSPEAARLLEMGGRTLAESVRGTARQKVRMLLGSSGEVLRSAVGHYGTRRQKRARDRALGLIARRAKLARLASQRGLVVIDDPYKADV